MNLYFLENVSMYAAYHRDWRNRLTHFVGIPVISFATMIPMAWLQVGSIGDYTVTAGHVFLVLIGTLFVWFDRLLGLASLALFAIENALAELVAMQGYWVGGITALVLFVGGWILQFVGHWWEGRKPALFVSPLQVFMAPPYFIAELCFALGWLRPLQADIARRSQKYDEPTPQRPDRTLRVYAS